MTKLDIQTNRLFRSALAALATAAFATACRGAEASGGPPQTEPATDISTAVAESRVLPETATATGSVIADRSSPVAADASGKVIAVYVERGDRVKEGQPLARLDVRSAALSASEAHAQLQAARSDAELARIECDRSRALFAKGAIARAQLDQETARCATTTESVAAARARAGMAGKAVKDGIIRAPFAGVISERLVQVGQYVRADSQIAVLVDADPLRLELAVPESLLPTLTIGQTVEFSALARPGQTYYARVSALAAQLDAASRSLDIEAEVVDGEGLLPGMFVAADLVLRERALPVVPRTALRKSGSSWRLFVVSDGALEERIVQLANPENTNSDSVAIAIGLDAGETVANPLTPELNDGLRVE